MNDLNNLMYKYINSREFENWHGNNNDRKIGAISAISNFIAWLEFNEDDK